MSQKYFVRVIKSYKDLTMDFAISMLVVFFCPLEFQLIFLTLATVSVVLAAQLSLAPLAFFGLSMDYLSWALVALTFLISFIMHLAWGQHMLVKLKATMAYLILATLLVLTLVFMVKDTLVFFVSFETSMLPVMVMIYGWGYQPERLKASLYLVFYTVVAALPLLLMILFLGQQAFSFLQVVLLQVSPEQGLICTTQMMMLIGCFLVKFPMYLFHLWLPKAHVEAPVSGSIILAAILLKLGGYGMLRFNSFIHPGLFVDSIQVLSMMGGALVGILCLLQKDLKVLIAYSSVSHMAMVISGCLTKLSSAVAASVLMMVAHGLASSGLFAVANLSYERSHSRNFLLNMGVLSVIPSLSMFWFTLSLANMGGPPSLNLLAEISLIVSLVKTNASYSCWVALIAFFSVAYGLILYTFVNQPSMSESSFFTTPLSSRETGLMVLHVIVLNLGASLGYLACL